MKFARFLGNRGFFPERLIVSAKQQVIEQLTKLGIDTLCLPEGYDGICCCLYDAGLQAQVEGAANFTSVYDPASFLIYRLDAVK